MEDTLPVHNKLLTKLGLIKSSSLELTLTEEEFIEKFKRRIGSSTNVFGHAAHNQEFHGSIKNSTFKIHRSIKFVASDITTGWGHIRQRQDKLCVDVYATIPQITLVLYIVVFSLCCLMPVIVSLFSKQNGLIIMVAIISIAFLLFIPLMLFSFRRSVSRFLLDLVTEFKNWQLFYHNELGRRSHR